MITIVDLNSLTDKKQTTKFSSVNFQKCKVQDLCCLQIQLFSSLVPKGETTCSLLKRSDKKLYMHQIYILYLFHIILFILLFSNG